MFSTEDIDRMKLKGMNIPRIEKQLEHFRSGFPPIQLARAATPGDGIMSLTPDEKKAYQELFDKNPGKSVILKFVPASGAASRMFKQLFEFIEKQGDHPVPDDVYFRLRTTNPVFQFIDNLEKFAFFDDLKHTFRPDDREIFHVRERGNFTSIIKHLLFNEGLGYASLPKALLKFHSYPDGARVAAEEHLVEAATYAKDQNNLANLHFTLSPEHIGIFEDRISFVLDKYERTFNVKFNISHSIQKPSTDTIAVDLDNQPFRNPDGTLLFRPAGHGALLENLNEIDADIIFIKNIDNIVPDRLKPETYNYKKLIGGYLMMLRNEIFNFMDKMERQLVNADDIHLMNEFVKTKLLISFPEGFNELPLEQKTSFLKELLNRPMRVCGMVKNEGEPGGGPFWVYDNAGQTSLQIIESSQVDMKDASQKMILDSSTHFNPVDLVCSIKDHRGTHFNLADFVDEQTGFISVKSSGGKNLKAQEVPGLWNGAMAGWITVFVEVPIITFNPVKTINDLLRNEHQS